MHASCINPSKIPPDSELKSDGCMYYSNFDIEDRPVEKEADDGEPDSLPLDPRKDNDQHNIDNAGKDGNFGAKGPPGILLAFFPCTRCIRH